MHTYRHHVGTGLRTLAVVVFTEDALDLLTQLSKNNINIANKYFLCTLYLIVATN